MKLDLALLLLASTFSAGLCRLQGETGAGKSRGETRQLSVDPCIARDINDCNENLIINGEGPKQQEQGIEKSAGSEASDTDVGAQKEQPPALVSNGDVMLTGENSVVELRNLEGRTTTLAAHWRAQFSTAGPGHVLFLQSDELTGGTVRAFTDNTELLGLVQDLEKLMRPQFGETDIRTSHCDFSHSEKRDVVKGYSEHVECYDEKITLTWVQDMTIEPFFITLEPDAIFPEWGVWSNIIPACSSSVVKEETKSGTITKASGEAVEAEMVGRESKTSFIAWGETWVKK